MSSSDSTATNGLLLIQLESPPDLHQRATLQQLGLTLLRYTTDNAWLGRGTNIRSSAIRALPFVSWVGEYLPAWKIHRSLAGSKARSAPAAITVLAASDTTGGELEQIRSLLTVVDQDSLLKSGRILRGTLAAGRMLDLANSPAVLWIEPGTHADSRTLAAVRDEVRATHQIVAPCTHRENCPLFQAANERDWCHYFAPAPAGIQNDSNWVRFSHRAGLDLRSQAYSCLVLSAAPSDQLPTGSSAARVLGRVEIFKPYARFLACDATGLHWLELTKRTDPALIKRLDKAPPVSLYALTHDGKRVSAMTPLVEPASPSAGDGF